MTLLPAKSTIRKMKFSPVARKTAAKIRRNSELPLGGYETVKVHGLPPPPDGTHLRQKRLLRLSRCRRVRKNAQFRLNSCRVGTQNALQARSAANAE